MSRPAAAQDTAPMSGAIRSTATDAEVVTTFLTLADRSASEEALAS